jgi:hypothetical protein
MKHQWPCRVTETAHPVAGTLARTYARIRAADDPAIFIARRECRGDRLGSVNENLPPFGVTAVVKDNIGVCSAHRGVPR